MISKRSYTGKRVAGGRQASISKGGRRAKAASAGKGKRSRFRKRWSNIHAGYRVSIVAGLATLVFLLASAITLRAWVRLPDHIPEIIVNNPVSFSEQPLPSGVSPPPDSRGNVSVPAQQGYVRREGVHTFLLAGIHEGNTDTLMVATLDTVNETCHVLSIPRDTRIERAPRRLKKINAAYSQKRDTWDDEPGMKQLKKEVATIIGYQPQYSAIVDYRGFSRLIEALGGVEFNVPMRMNVPAEGIDLQKGFQRLNGNQAMQLVRFRVDYATGAGYDDYGRMRTQQQLLAAAGKKALSNWTKIGEYIDIARQNITSEDIDWGHMLGFAEQINKIGIDNVQFNTLPTYTSRDGSYYELVSAEEALELINETINPFSRPIGMEVLEY